MEGGQLAEIETAAEDTFLRTQLQDKYGQGFRFWVGGTYVNKDGTWAWGKSGSVITYAGWGQGEPNSIGNAYCMDMDGINHRYAWNNQQCLLLEGSICEKELKI